MPVARAPSSRFAGAMSTRDAATYLNDLAKWRAERDGFFANHYATPLSDEAISAFSGLRYFPVDPNVVFDGDLEAVALNIGIESSTGTTSEYPAAGKMKVPFPAGTVELWVLWGEGDTLFVPFRDATSGVSTYSGGRYVAVEKCSDGVARVDFNKATNPYCAYDPDFSCPLPPRENRLAFPVEAGELDYP